MSSEQSIDRPKTTCPDTWLDEHGDALFGYAMLRVDSRELAEDLVQETFLAALGARERFRGFSSERTWLIAILRRKIVDHIRRRSRHERFDQSDEIMAELFDRKGSWRKTLASTHSNPAKAFEKREFWQVLRECLSGLPPLLADAFLLRELDECETAEICSVLEISATSLSTRLYRARMLLRRCMERNWLVSNS